MAVYFGNTDLNITSPQPFYLGTTAVASLWMGSVQVWPPVVYDFNIFLGSGSIAVPDLATLSTKLTGATLVSFEISGSNVSATSLTSTSTVANAFRGTSLSGITSISSSIITSLGNDSFNGNPGTTDVFFTNNSLKYVYLPNTTTLGFRAFRNQDLNYISQTDPNAQVYLPLVTGLGTQTFSYLTGSFFNNIIFSASLPYVTNLSIETFSNINANTSSLPTSNSGLIKISQTEDFGGLYIPLVNSMARQTFSHNFNLISASLPFVSQSTSNTFLSTFANCYSIDRVSDNDPTWPVYLPGISNASSTFINCTNLKSASLFNPTGSGAMFTNTSLEYISNNDPSSGGYFPNMVDLFFSSIPTLKRAIFHNARIVRGHATSGGFGTCPLLTYIDLTNLTNNNIALGGTAGDNKVFANSGLNGTLIIPTYFATNNGGNPDGDIQYLIGRGWTINYV